MPELQPVVLFGLREIHQRIEAPSKRLIKVCAQIRGEDGNALEELHPLQQISHLDVGVAVMRIADLTSLTEQGVGFVEEDHTVNPLGLREDPIEVLLCLADVFVHHGREVNRVKVETKLGGEHLGGHRLAGPGGTRK